MNNNSKDKEDFESDKQTRRERFNKRKRVDKEKKPREPDSSFRRDKPRRNSWDVDSYLDNENRLEDM